MSEGDSEGEPLKVTITGSPKDVCQLMLDLAFAVRSNSWTLEAAKIQDKMSFDL